MGDTDIQGKPGGMMADASLLHRAQLASFDEIIPPCHADCARHWTGVRNDNARLRAVLNDCIVAIDDWLNTYAHDMCEDHRVQEARDRIAAHGGTLAYIARLQATNRAALKRENPA